MARVGILVFSKLVKCRATRKNVFFDSFKYLGINAIAKEIDRKKHSVRFISPLQLKDIDFALVPLHSYRDAMNLIKNVKGIPRNGAKIIVGGQGLLNVRSYLDYFDLAVFGRAEGQINEILEGARPSNVLDLEKDPRLEKRYTYRQPQNLVDGERNVGCRNKCLFCFYSWTHKLLFPVKRYNSTVYDNSVEDDIRSLDVQKPGHFITAIDGFSEASRFKVNKKIKNSHIVDKLSGIRAKNFKKTIFIKIFSICGYPWESPSIHYLDEFKEALAEGDRAKGSTNIILVIHSTPFSPEPLTPMEDCYITFENAWRKFFLNQERLIYKSSKLQAYSSVYIDSRASLVERMAVHRAGEEGSEILEKYFMNRRFQALKDYQKMLYLKEAGLLDRFATSTKADWSYLKSDQDYSKLKERFNDQALS